MVPCRGHLLSLYLAFPVSNQLDALQFAFLRYLPARGLCPFLAEPTKISGMDLAVGKLCLLHELAADLYLIDPRPDSSQLFIWLLDRSGPDQYQQKNLARTRMLTQPLDSGLFQIRIFSQ